MNVNEEQNASIVEDITRTLRDNSIQHSEEDITQRVRELIDSYNVPVTEVKRTILRDMMGSVPSQSMQTIEKELSEIKGEERGLDVTVRIVTVNPKTVTVEGQQKEIFYGLVTDGELIIPYTAWDDFKLQKGDTVKLVNITTKVWQEKPQININRSSAIQKVEADIPMPETMAHREMDIGQLKANMSGLIVKGRILDAEPKIIEVKGEQRQIFEGVIADGTGKIRFTCWNGFDQTIEDVIRIDGCYTREFGGVPQLNFDQRTKVTYLGDSEVPTMDELQQDTAVRFSDLTEKGGALAIVATATIVEIRQGSGLVHRCPVCNRALKKDVCMLHGKQDGIPDLRLKAVLDDGTGTCGLIVARPGSEALLELTMEDCITLAKEKVDMDYPRQLMVDRLLGRSFRVHGDVTSDEYGLRMITNEVDPYDPDLAKEASAILKSMGVDA